MTQKPLSWLDVGKGFVHNAIPSAVNVAKDIGKGTIAFAKDPVMNTVGMLEPAALGIDSYYHPEKYSPQQMKYNRSVADSMWGSVADKYATKDAAGRRHFDMEQTKRTLANDPASIALDLSSVLPTAGGALRLAGKAANITGKAARAAKILDTAGTVVKTTGDYLNPVYTGGKGVAKVASKFIGPPKAFAKQMWASQSGVPTRLMDAAKEAGRAGGPAAESFKKFHAGEGSAQEMQRAAIRAVEALKRDASADYLAKRGPMAATPVNLSDVLRDIALERGRLRKGAPGGFPEAKKALDDAENLVLQVMVDPDPTRRTLDHVDSLKQQIYDLHQTNRNNEAGRVIDKVYHSTRNAMTSVDPEYANMMEGWQSNLNNIKDLQRTLGADAKVDASKAIGRQIRALKTPSGESLLDQLAAKEPTLMPMLAGEVTQPVGAKSIVPLTMGGLGTIAGGVGAFTGNPGLLAIPAIQSFAQSPRLAGAVNFGLGRMAGSAPGRAAATVARTVDKMTPDLPQTTSLIGEGYRAQQQQPKPLDDVFEPRFFSGEAEKPDTPVQPVEGVAPLNYQEVFGEDRPARASGGKVEGHQHLVDRLIAATDKAKAETSRQTKPLLNADDDMIAHALAVAEKAI